jgi:redox-sensitive bicupin YhaK (pirin superfamily)
MIKIRKAGERGHTQLGWLDSRHSFSFGDYYDPANMGFSVLRVINDDEVAPARGFGTHPHRDMEILTYVTHGAVEHRDSIGTHGVIPAGEVQIMSAGTGIQHSEMNPSPSEPLRLLQIWILPKSQGLKPRYEQRSLPPADREGFALIASPDGRDGSLVIHQDVIINAATLKEGATVTRPLPPSRKAYVQTVRGAVTLNGERMSPGDGAQIAGEKQLEFTGTGTDAELLLFELP